MKKISAIILLALLLFYGAFLAGFAADSGEQGSAAETAAQQSEGQESTFGTVFCTGIVAFVTDMNEDGFIDDGGKIEIKLLCESPLGYITLAFSEDEFDDIAISYGKSKNVSTAAGCYAVNTVLSMEYYGDIALLEKIYFSEADIEKIEKCFISACFKNGEDVADTVLPMGNEVYSTYLSVNESRKAELPKGVNEAGFSFEYDAEGGTATLSYRGIDYTVVKKLGSNAENPIVVTENGEVLAPSEIAGKIKSLAEGEMLAVFGDIKQNEGETERIFELLDLKKSRSFAPISAEFNPYSGLKGEALSYILFDREARASVPPSHVFSTRTAAGAGLSVVLAPCDIGAGYYANVKAYASSDFDDFEAVRGEKIAEAEQAGKYIKVTLESGKTALLPSAELLQNREMEAKIFYELEGEVCSQTARINTAESSWFASLNGFFEVNGNGESALVGAELTAVLASDGVAVYAEIN